MSKEKSTSSVTILCNLKDKALRLICIRSRTFRSNSRTLLSSNFCSYELIPFSKIGTSLHQHTHK